MKGEFKKAYEYYHKSLSISESNELHHVSYVTYYDMSETYQTDGQLDSAVHYLHKYYHLKDSLQGADVQKELLSLQSAQENILKEQEITKLNQRNRIQKQQLFITYGGVTGLLTLFFFIFRNMSLSNKHKKEIAQEKLKQTQQREELQILKVEKLNQELEHKKQDITRMAIAISQKQEFYNDLLGQITTLKQHNNPDASKQWRGLENTIKNRLQNNDEQSLFNENINIINQAFYDKLKDNYPSLSKNELNLCGFIRLGLSNKEIANLRNVSSETVRVGKFRLKKKLNYSSNEEVEQLLQSI